jgi:hypothetical protein
MKNYGKDKVTTILVVIIITFFLTLIAGSIQEHFFALGNLALFVERIIATSRVIKSARSLNRPTTGWGFVAFFFPIITLIVMINKINKQVKFDIIKEQLNR